MWWVKNNHNFSICLHRATFSRFIEICALNWKMYLNAFLQEHFLPPKDSTFRGLFREMDERLRSLGNLYGITSWQKKKKNNKGKTIWLGLDFSTERKVKKSQKIRAVLQIMPLIFGYYLCFKGILSTKIQDPRFISFFVGTALCINVK